MSKQLIALTLISLFSFASYSQSNANQIKNFLNSTYVSCSSKAQRYQTINFANRTSTEGREWAIEILPSLTPTVLQYKYKNHPTKKNYIYVISLVNLQKRAQYGNANVQNSWDAYASTVGGFTTPGLTCRFDEPAPVVQ